MNQILVHEKVIVTPEFRRKKKVYKFNFFLSVFLLCTLFSCYIYAEYDRNKSEQVSQEILFGLQEIEDLEEQTVDDTTISVENDILYVTLLSRTPDETVEVDITNLINPQTQEGVKEQPKIVESVSNDGKSYYSEAILLSDTSDELLKISLNKLWGPKPNEVGNYVIIGHNYKSGKMFGKLKSIKIGDIVKLEDLNKKTVSYEVYDKTVIEPEDVSCTSQRTNGKKEITLITCENSGKQRLAVKAREIQ